MVKYGFKEGETAIIVTATDENGSVARNFIKVIVEKNSGVETVNIDSDVTIYPNPVVTAAHVTCNFDSDKTTYRLYTSKGERVYEETASKARGEVQIIDMTGLSAGVYLLQVEANGATTTLSLIKK